MITVSLITGICFVVTFLICHYPFQTWCTLEFSVYQIYVSWQLAWQEAEVCGKHFRAPSSLVTPRTNIQHIIFANTDGLVCVSAETEQESLHNLGKCGPDFSKHYFPACFSVLA